MRVLVGLTALHFPTTSFSSMEILLSHCSDIGAKKIIDSVFLLFFFLFFADKSDITLV